jgi:hypothetical protein
MMHRIRPDNEGNIWFTEMATDKIGKLTIMEKMFVSEEGRDSFA